MKLTDKVTTAKLDRIVKSNPNKNMDIITSGKFNKKTKYPEFIPVMCCIMVETPLIPPGAKSNGITKECTAMAEQMHKKMHAG
jgi:hypothetical protein